MVKRQVLSPKQDGKRRVTKSASRVRWQVSDNADQASHGSPQQKVDCHRILALVPFIRVTDHRQSADGAAEVKMECNTWVDRGYLEKLESVLKQLEKPMSMEEDLGQKTGYFNRPPTKQDEDLANQAMAEALAKYPRTSMRSPRNLNPAKQSTVARDTPDLAADQPLVADQPMRHKNTSLRRANSGFVVDNSDEAAHGEEWSPSENSVSDLDLTETDEDSESNREEGGLSGDSFLDDSESDKEEGELSEDSLFDADLTEELDLAEEARALTSARARLVDTRGSVKERGEVV